MYRKHVFICTNVRENSTKPSCGAQGGLELRDYAKQRIKELKLTDVRINQSGCLGQCLKGPAVVVYPDNQWFQCKTIAEMEEIIQTLK